VPTADYEQIHVVQPKVVGRKPEPVVEDGVCDPQADVEQDSERGEQGADVRCPAAYSLKR